MLCAFHIISILSIQSVNDNLFNADNGKNKGVNSGEIDQKALNTELNKIPVEY